MKQGDIIKAYKIIRKIGGELDIPWGLKRRLADFRRQLQPTWDFQAEQERATVDSLQERYKKKAGETLTDEEITRMQNDLNARLNELAETDVDIEIEPIRICVTAKLEKVLNKILTGNELIDLDGFVIFEEEGEDK